MKKPKTKGKGKACFYELSVLMLAVYVGVAWVAGKSGAVEAAVEAVKSAF